MTKTQELELLDETIQRLGAQSYLGPWLSENRNAIERDIRADNHPTIDLPAEAAKRARAIITEAEARAKELIAHATAAADTQRRQCNDQVISARTRAAEMLKKAAEELDPYRYLGVKP